LMCIDSLLFKV